MIRALLAILLLSCGTLSQAQGTPSLPSGEALYSLHCNACHGEQIHWRDNKLATNWDGIKTQVRRWQGNLKLDWTEREIEDVTRYLNTLYYRYPSQENSVSLNTRPAAKK